MAGKPVSAELAQQALDTVTSAGGQVAAEAQTGIPRGTLQHRLRAARRMGLTPSAGVADRDSPEYLKARIRNLEAELTTAQRQVLNDAMVRRHIVGIADKVSQSRPPAWLLKMTKPDSAPGVPTLFLSDLHWGEVVEPSQINGVNHYSAEIARARLRRMAERAVRLLAILHPPMDFPGIVIALGGDMVSGDIHDELTATNDLTPIEAVLDLHDEMAALLTAMADRFGKVYVPCVTGNHGRTTRKMWAKNRNVTNADWLLYQFLAKYFARDKRVTFEIPDGSDAYWRVYEHRYLMTHGDQFRGGDGMIGALGPIIRGDHKKRSRNAQIDMEYDTMLLGHWHQYIHHSRVIVNGSLKGYDEYAYANNFGFEPPQQALWMTHPAYGITYRMPVYADRMRAPGKSAWVSVAA